MSTDLSLTDKSTWVIILTWVVAVLGDVFHRSFAPYVPQAASLAAGIVTGVVILAKHHYQGAVAQAAAIAKNALAGSAAPVTNVTVPGAAATVHVEASQADPAVLPAPVSPPAAPSAAQPPAPSS